MSNCLPVTIFEKSPDGTWRMSIWTPTFFSIAAVPPAIAFPTGSSPVLT